MKFHEKKNILITGASGLIGSRLIKSLQEKGHRVCVLSRDPAKLKGIKAFHWNVEEQKIDKNAFNGVDTVVHLAGAGIADKRWNRRRKQLLIDSRVLSTKLLYDTIAGTNSPIHTIISASATGYYGDRGDEILGEESKNGTGFLAECCKKWEEAVDKGTKKGIRVVKLRIGLVLSKQGGALAELEKPVSFFLGAHLGTGRQWMPWIHLTDLLGIIDNAVENPLYNGTYNACSPFPVTNYEFTKLLAKKLFRPFWPIKVPEIVLRSILGEMSEVILISNRTSSQKLIDMGFRFRYPGLDKALSEIYSH